MSWCHPLRAWLTRVVTASTVEGVFVGVWHINDSGDVAPRWKIGGEKSGLKRPNGVALIPEHKEISIPDMRHNAVLTFYFPEIF